MRSLGRRVALVFLPLGLLASSCGGYSNARPTRIDDGREDDHFLEGERCPVDPNNMPDAAIRVETIEPGTGDIVEKGMTVRVHYVAKTASGAVVHDTRSGGAPNQIVVGSTHTICGFEKGILGMRAGEERRIFVPWQLGYGEAGHAPEIAPRTDLVFVVDLYLPADYVPMGVGHGNKAQPTGGMGGGRRR